MPRKMTTRNFVINQLKALSTWKKTPPSTRLRALYALAVIENLGLDVKFRDHEPNSGDNPESAGENELNSTVNKMLEAALNMGKRGGENGGNKLPNS